MGNMRILFIFASYDKDSIIDDYVVYYLNELAKIGDIIFVCDNDLSETESQKINSMVLKVFSGRHGQYDFGSYKIGFRYALQEGLLDVYDWVVICNDSVYGPFYPLMPIFFRMKDIDVWGFSKNTASKRLPTHLQSYFIVMSSKVAKNVRVQNFFRNIKKCNSKREIVTLYEAGLSVIFYECGYSIGSFFNKDVSFKYDPQKSYYLKMISKGFPFLKRQLLIKNVNGIPNLYKYKKIKEMSPDYPFDAISKNILRLAGEETLKNTLFRTKTSRILRIVKKIFKKYVPINI